MDETSAPSRAEPRSTVPAAARIAPLVLALAAGALAALTFLRNRDYRSALELWRGAAREAPANARAHLNLGSALIEAGRPAEALTALVTAHELEPRAGLTNLLLGIAYVRLDRPAEALPYLRQAVERLDDARCYDNLGHALLVTGAAAEAVPFFERALALTPEDAELHYRLAQAQAQLQRVPAAVQHYGEALRLDPRHQGAALNLSALMAQLGRGEEALELARRALAVQPDTVEEHFGLGRALLTLERYGEAMQAFRAASLLVPEMPEPYAAFAECALHKVDATASELTEALGMARKAHELARASRPEFGALVTALEARLAPLRAR